MRTKSGAAALSVISNTTLVALKLIVGILTGSVSIISEAAHSAIDLVASILAFFSVRAADIPADEHHPFGHGKIENVSAVIEAVLIVVAAGYIIYEALGKLPDALAGKAELNLPLLGVVVMFISVAANYLISWWLFKVAKRTDSVALEADGHHLRTDVWTSLGVFVGLLVIQFTGWIVLDSIVALAVAAMILKVAISLIIDAGGPLVDVRLPSREVELVSNILLSEERIIGYHKLRTRKAGAERHVDVHLIVPEKLSVTEAHDLAEEIEDKIREELGGAFVITHVEPATDENLRETPIEGLVENGDDKDC